jgi:hypothetical protein
MICGFEKGGIEGRGVGAFVSGENLRERRDESAEKTKRTWGLFFWDWL